MPPRPIAQAGILFLNTLFDENAASHIALGRGYDMTVEGTGSMNEAEKRATGLNDSSVHVDFRSAPPRWTWTAYRTAAPSRSCAKGRG